MNDMILFGGVLIAVACAIVAVMAYARYGGSKGSLANAKVGEVYNFEYEQPYHGDPERVLAKVIEPVHTLDDESIRRLNARSRYRANDPQFKRTKHLVTCEMADGSIRNFYAERTRNVKKAIFGASTFGRAVAALI
jgi:hypothetical protein